MPIDYINFETSHGLVLAKGTGWEAQELREKVSVLRSPGGFWEMLYCGLSAGQGTSKIGYAFSKDGKTWTKFSQNPVISRSSQDQDPCWVKDGSTYRCYVEVADDKIEVFESLSGLVWTSKGIAIPSKASSPVVWKHTDGQWKMLWEHYPPDYPATEAPMALSVSDDGISWTFVGDVLVDPGGTSVPDSVVFDGSKVHVYYHRSEGTNHNSWPCWHAESTDLLNWTNRARLTGVPTTYSSPSMIVVDGELLGYFWDTADRKYYLRYGQPTGPEPPPPPPPPGGGPLYHDANVRTFNGSQFHDTGFSQQLPIFTVCCFVTSPAAPSSQQASGPFHREKNWQMNWNHQSSNSRGAGSFEKSGTWYKASFGTLLSNTRYHLALSYDGTNLRSYKNGIPVNTTNTGGGNPSTETATAKIGRHATENQNFFVGTVEDCRVYDNVQTDAQIAALAAG